MKSNRYIHVALTVGALAAAPALATAQTGSTGQPHQRESGTPGAAQGGAQQGGSAHQGGSAQGGSAQQGGSAKPQGDQAGASGGQRAQQQGQGQKKQAMKPMKLHEQISFQVEEGCTYTASVNGRIEQAAAGKSQQPSGSQPGGGSQGRGGTGAQGQTGGAAQAPGSGAHAHAGAAQGRDQDTGGVQAPAGGAQAGGAQGGSQAQAGRAQGGNQDQAGRAHGGSQDQAGRAQGGSQDQAGRAQGERQAQAGGAQSGSQPGSRAGDQEKVKPDLTVSASMSCPNTPELRVTDTLKTDAAVSRSELEEMISRRASIATQKSGRFCMYVPQFELTREKLSGKGIAQLCRVPAPDQKQGMR
ncbi:hypothetical protein [Sorangium sp. So ce406]|uniref:hypothetical protein n=1 Tax=Sorangium sp. So ce406 TaxID=3133311 RepID=UPI003F5B89CC